MSDGPTARFFLLSFVFAGLAACSAPTEPEAVGIAEGELGEAATIRFEGNFEERVTGTIQKGRKARIVYDAARLTQCRGEQGGSPFWAISGNYRIGSGPVRTFPVAGLNADPQGATIDLDASGELQVWFENTNRWGCHAFDSDFGQNYRFAVKPAAHEPGWIGNIRYAIERVTCEGGPCDSTLRPVPAELVYDSWARQRAAVRVITFETWKEGVTDFDNGDLWKQLDVQVHTRVQGTTTFASSYVRFSKRAGNNARYAVDLTAIDPIPGHVMVQDKKDCPAFPLKSAANGAYVEATLELYMTVNGVEVRPEGAGSDGLFRVRYQNYADRFAPCVAP